MNPARPQLGISFFPKNIVKAWPVRASMFTAPQSFERCQVWEFVVMMWGFARCSLVTWLAIRYFFNTWSHLTQTPDVPKQTSEAFAKLRGILTQSWYIDAWQKQVFQHCFLTLGGFSKKTVVCCTMAGFATLLTAQHLVGFPKKRFSDF